MTPLAILPGMGYDPFIHCLPAKDTQLHEALSHAFCGVTRPQRRQAQSAVERAFLRSGIGSVLVPASDSGPSEKRYCCVVDETPHKWASKIAPIPRKAVGYTLVPHWTRIEGTLAKSGCH